MSQRGGNLRLLWPTVIGLLALVAYYQVGERYFDGYLLDLGSIGAPTPRYVQFVTMWAACGTLAIACFAISLVRVAGSDGATGLRVWWRTSPDWQWMVLGSAAALLVPLALRAWLLDGAPLTDDESAYHFMAQLLASGRVHAWSPPLKLFFDRVFMINDGSLYASYFLGWPALMVPGVWLGVAGAMNAVYSAATVPALFLVARRLAGRSWARVGVLIYLASPMLMVAAATELSHTSCLMALAWTTWFVLRSRDVSAPWWVHAGVALGFSVAFFIRPTAAAGIGAPLLLWWLIGLRTKTRLHRLSAGSAFFAPALLMAGVFLLANHAQTGTFTVTPYHRGIAYLEANGYRFAGHTQEEAEQFARFNWARTIPTIPSTLAFALIRMNFDLFGWPSSLVLGVFAMRRKGSGWLWLMLLTFAALHAILVPLDVGIDSFGPTHYFELAWPIVLLNVLGLRSLGEAKWLARLAGSRRGDAAVVPGALAIGAIVAALAGYVPVRFGALARIADNINMPAAAVADAPLHNAIVFAPRPFAPNCRSEPTRHFVFFRPNNDPDLRNDVLWVNHLTVDQDRRLIEYFRGRCGYVMAWVRPCKVRLFPLDELESGALPDGFIGGTGQGLD